MKVKQTKQVSGMGGRFTLARVIELPDGTPLPESTPEVKSEPADNATPVSAWEVQE